MTFYVLVLPDLAPGQKIAQACHAALEAGLWQGSEPSSCSSVTDAQGARIVVAEATAEEIDGLCDRASFELISFVKYTEPDMGDALTAACIGPVPDGKRRLFSGPPLAFSVPR